VNTLGGLASTFARYGIAETKGKKASSAKKHRARKAKAPLQQGNTIEARRNGTL